MNLLCKFTLEAEAATFMLSFHMGPLATSSLIHMDFELVEMLFPTAAAWLCTHTTCFEQRLVMSVVVVLAYSFHLRFKEKMDYYFTIGIELVLACLFVQHLY